MKTEGEVSLHYVLTLFKGRHCVFIYITSQGLVIVGINAALLQ